MSQQLAHRRRPSVRRAYPSDIILAEIRQQVASGRWKPGEQIPSETDLAVQFGVCRATMNKTLNELEREGLFWGGPGRGRFVSQRPAKPKTGVIEAVVAEAHILTELAGMQTHDAMSQVVAQAGYHYRIVQLNSFEYPDIAECMKVVNPRQIDGCIIHTQAVQLETAKALAAQVPTVWFHQTSQGPGLTGIRYDWVGGAFAAARHLIELGHRRLGLVTVLDKFVAGREQISGARLAVRNLLGEGEGSLEVVTASLYRPEEGYRMTRELLQRTPRPTGIICASDEFARGVLKALADAHLRVPQDMSVIAWNDTLPAHECPVPMTSMKMDFERAGTAAAEALLRMIEQPGETIPTIEIETELVVRQSTADVR